jgi:hypothetical protein
MAASVQGWRTKWFYIKDRKASPEDQYGLAPFDASREVKKLASWDALPSDAEVQQVLPLLSRIQALKGGQGGALSGIQLMAFFIQCRVQPLHHRLTKFWNYSGLEDPTRVSEDLIEKKDVNKRVRSLTKLTKDHAVADLTADYFDSVHPLPEVCIFVFICCRFLLALTYICLCTLLTYFIRRVTNSLFRTLLFQRQGLFQLNWPHLYLKPLRLTIIRTGMTPKSRKRK